MNFSPTAFSKNRSTLCFLTGWAVLSSAEAQQPQPAPAPPEPAPLTADPARDLYEAAQLAYAEAKSAKQSDARKIAYESSLRTFERFRKAFPNDRRATEAQFYIASCYEKLGNKDQALSVYTSLANSGASGPLVEAAAQQVANTYYQNKNYEAAEPLFARLATVATKAETRHIALFQRALCLQHLDRTDDLKAALRAVVFDSGSPYQEKARAAISALYVKTGEKSRAYSNYKILAESKDAKVAADATLQSALLARELKKPESNQWFVRILQNPQLAEWHGKAQLTLMSQAYDAKDYPQIIKLYERGNYKLPRDQDAQRIAMAAEAYRLTGDGDTANELYARLSKVSTNKNQAFDAGYAVLTREYQKGQASFLKAGEDFLKKYEAAHNEDPRVDNVHLMLAEKYSASRNYTKAAQQYGSINLSRIDAANIPRVRYRLAYARMKSGDRKGARDSFNVFLEKHPADKNAVRALAHRAAIQVALGAEEAATADYELLLSRTNEAAFRLQALSGMAELFRKKENFPKLISTHQRLLKEFPKRPVREVAASHFILGWSYFKQDQTDLALPQFQQARQLNPSGLGKDATIHLALIYFARQDEKALQPELDRLLKEFPDSGLPRPVYAWLGAKRASDGAYAEAWKYLNKAATPNKPGDTKPAVWKAYALSAEALGHHQETLQACDILLPLEESAYLRAVLLHRKSKALLGLRQYRGASEVAKQALELKPQGELNAQLRVTLGDIARSQDDLDGALSHYVVVAEIIGTGDTKTAAIRRAIEAYEEKGDATSLAASAKYKQLLK
ncbi:tetratricopeptide repeat protein [Roseibacillus persicicus]|uniref:tetratricopeptide repeat protein n=1 Tax=Roseibacillus persicicus TaxID=454148 RepID=UPI00280E8E6E|nr:tetratricopeptide repeat protein [Roseibacillus persicicus]MDQ8189642.1 tetratricopeptide repeat protein [Roseibacillus persicicus]